MTKSSTSDTEAAANTGMMMRDRGSYRYLNAEGNEEVNEEVNVEGNKEEAFGSQSQPSVGKRARGQRVPRGRLRSACHSRVGQDDRPIAPADAARNYVHHSGWVVRITSPST